MRQMLRFFLPLVAILALTVSVAVAQTAPTQPSAPPGGLGTSPPMSASPPQEKLIDGPVKKVDPMAKTVQVGWFLGLFNTTLEVTDDTRIAVEGAKGSLQDIREGDRVKAAYAAQDGKNIAKSIEVTQTEPQKGAAAPGRSPASSGAPMGASPGSTGSAPGSTKAP